jgi:hypothetical protein
VSNSVASTLSAASLASAAAAAAVAGTSISASDVVVQIKQVARIELAVAGKTLEEMRSALKTMLCAAAPNCDVVSISRRALQPSGPRRLAAGSFQLTKTIDASSSDSLAAPTIDRAVVANQLGLASSSGITTSSNLQSVEASVTVVKDGSASSDGAQAAAASAQASLPAALATGLSSTGASASDFGVTTSVIGPPTPPPTPPPPLPPPSLSPSPPPSPSPEPGTSFTPPPLPPTPTRWTVAVTFTVAGDVTSFDRPGFERRLLSLFPAAAAASVVVSPASVLASASLLMPTASDAASAEQKLRDSSPAALSAQLGVTIEAVSTPTVLEPGAAEPISSGASTQTGKQADGGSGGGVIAGGVIGGIVVAGALFGLCMYRRRIGKLRATLGGRGKHDGKPTLVTCATFAQAVSSTVANTDVDVTTLDSTLEAEAEGRLSKDDVEDVSAGGAEIYL